MLLCEKAFPGKTQHTRLLTPDREPMMNRSTDIPTAHQSQLGEPTSFTGATYRRTAGEGSLTGAEMTE